VDTILDLYSRLPRAKTGHDKEVVLREIDATDRQIDRVVFSLYGLSAAEAQFVEDSMHA
jgi:hypothetical protein